MIKPTLVPPPSQLLTIQMLARRFGVSQSTIWRWEASGRLPRGIRVTSHTVRWHAEDIENHVASLGAK